MSFKVDLPDGEHEFDGERVKVRNGEIIAIWHEASTIPKRRTGWYYLPREGTMPEMNIPPYPTPPRSE